MGVNFGDAATRRFLRSQFEGSPGYEDILSAVDRAEHARMTPDALAGIAAGTGPVPGEQNFHPLPGTEAERGYEGLTKDALAGIAAGTGPVPGEQNFPRSEGSTGKAKTMLAQMAPGAAAVKPTPEGEAVYADLQAAAAAQRPPPPEDAALPREHWMRVAGDAVGDAAKAVGRGLVGLVDDPEREEWWDAPGSKTPDAGPRAAVPAADTPAARAAPSPPPAPAAPPAAPPPSAEAPPAKPSRSKRVEVGRAAETPETRTAVAESAGRPPNMDTVEPGPTAPTVAQQVRGEPAPDKAAAPEDELAQLQREANRRADFMASMQLLDKNFADIAGAAPSTDFYRGQLQAADREVEQYAQRTQDAERKRLESERQVGRDPTSARSRMMQKALVDVSDGLFTPEEAATMSAADIEGAKDFIQLKLQAQQKLAQMQAASAEKAADRQARRELASITSSGAREMREARLQDAQDKRDEALIQKASKDFEGPSGFADAMATIKAALRQKDMPGVGRVAGPLSSLGFSSNEGLQLRQAMQTLHNALLKETSGGAVTPSEAERKAIETGMGATASEDQARVGAEAMVRNLERAWANRRAKYPQRTLEAIEARGGWTPPAQGAKATSPQDTAAIAWARAHPDDPRAARILEMNR